MYNKGVFSDSEIIEAIKDGHIIMQPYNLSHIRGSSVDVTLGYWYYTTELTKDRSYYNPFSKEDVKNYFGEPKKAVIHKIWCKKQNRLPFKGIPLNHPIIVLGPGERILAHTHEFIGINPPGTTEMRARSSWGRNGIATCFDAGWGDPGYINRWTMEIYNLNERECVPLPIGERVAQIIFHHTGKVKHHYGKSGKYQKSKDIKKIIDTWRPDMMLPKAFKDIRIAPKKLKCDK